MRAPPESFRPITGAPTRIAWSMILQIFSACASESEPPNTVKSWLNTNTRRPFTVPEPVTTPSPGIRCSAMPKSLQRCSTNMSISSNEPGSRSSSRRSRADSLPRLCCAAIRRAPPPIRAPCRLASSCSRISCTGAPCRRVVTPQGAVHSIGPGREQTPATVAGRSRAAPPSWRGSRPTQNSPSLARGLPSKEARDRLMRTRQWWGGASSADRSFSVEERGTRPLLRADRSLGYLLILW